MSPQRLVPPHHRRPPSPAGSIAPIIHGGVAGVLLGLVLAASLTGVARPVGLVVSVVAGLVLGVLRSERTSDSRRWQLGEARRRGVR